MVQIVDDIKEYRLDLLKEIEKFKELAKTDKDRVALEALKTTVNTLISDVSVKANLSPEYTQSIFFRLLTSTYGLLASTSLSEEVIDHLYNVLESAYAFIFSLAMRGTGLKSMLSISNISVSENRD